MKCLICPDRHNLLRSGKELLVVLADQHVTSCLPGCGDGRGCIPVIRFSNLSLERIFKLVLEPVVTSLSSHRNTEDFNGGLITLISAAIKREVTVRLAITSGTSEVLDGPANYTAQMQRLVLWAESD